MDIVIAFIVGAVLGFIAGFLVFRKHQAKINAAEVEAKEAVDKLKDTVDEIKNK